MLSSRVIYSLFLSGIILLLSGCGDNDSDNSDKNGGNASLNNAEIVLSEDGIGPINTQTPFNIHQITEAFQNYEYHVEEIKTQNEGKDSYPVIRVSKGTDTLLLINPALDQTKIFSVVVKDKLVGNALGHWIGMKYGSVYSYGQLEQCASGTEGLSGKVLCYAPKSGNVLYMFGDKKPNDFPDGKMPPIDALSEWELEAIIWKPKK